MNSSNLIDVLKDGNIIIPLFFLKKIKKMDLELDEFILLMYLYMYKEDIQFNPEKISSDLGIELSQVMLLISSITDKIVNHCRDLRVFLVDSSGRLIYDRHITKNLSIQIIQICDDLIFYTSIIIP